MDVAYAPATVEYKGMLRPRNAYRGWHVLAAISGMNFANGATTIGVLTVFVLPFAEDFGWSRTEIAGATSICSGPHRCRPASPWPVECRPLWPNGALVRQSYPLPMPSFALFIGQRQTHQSTANAGECLRCESVAAVKSSVNSDWDGCCV